MCRSCSTCPGSSGIRKSTAAVVWLNTGSPLRRVANRAHRSARLTAWRVARTPHTDVSRAGFRSRAGLIPASRARCTAKGEAVSSEGNSCTPRGWMLVHAFVGKHPHLHLPTSAAETAQKTAEVGKSRKKQDRSCCPGSRNSDHQRRTAEAPTRTGAAGAALPRGGRRRRGRRRGARSRWGRTPHREPRPPRPCRG